MQKSIAIICSVFSFVAAPILWYLKRRSHKPVDLKSTYSCKVAVVTGAAHGVGQTIVKKVVSQGLDVVAIDCDSNALQGLKASVEAAAPGSRVYPYSYDLCKCSVNPFAQAFDAFLAEHCIEADSIGAFFSNAGRGAVSCFEDHTDSTIRDVINCNLTSSVELASYFYKVFLKRGVSGKRGCIFFTSSFNALIPMPSTALYCLSKSGLSSFAGCLYEEGKGRGVDVLTIHPAAISNTRFKESEDMKLISRFQRAKDMERNGRAVTGEDVVEQMLCSIGRRCYTYLGRDVHAALLIKRFVPTQFLVDKLAANWVRAYPQLRETIQPC